MNCKTMIRCAASAAFAMGFVSACRAQAVVAVAKMREEIRQQTEWTSENIAKNPYLFIQDQIRQCDALKAKIEAQTITLTRMEKEAARKVEEADGTTARYEKFLKKAKEAYKAAEDNDSWPAIVNGYEMDEEELGDKIADALERVELAKTSRRQNTVIAQKVEIRQAALKKKKRELASIRLKLVQQAEQVKMNSALAEIEGLKDVLGTISDMMIEVDEDPAKLSIDDLAAEDPNGQKKKAIRDFLDK